MNLIRSALAGILALFVVASASAQQFPVIQDHSVIGRIGIVGQSGPSQAIPFPNLAPFILGPGTNTNALVNGAAFVTTPTVNSSFCGLLGALGGSALYTVTVGAASTFPANCVLTFTNIDVNPALQREKILSGFPSNVLSTLWPGQTVQIVNINNNWLTNINPGKWRPNSPIVFNVATTGTDAAGCALGTGAAACATGQFAMTMLCQNIDPSLLNPATIPSITIQYATGAYTQNINSFCDPGPFPWLAVAQGGWLKIAGNTNLTSVTLACGAGPCFSPTHSLAGWWIEGFATTGTGYSVVGDAGTHLYLGTNSYGTTGASAGDFNCAFGSLVEAEANFTSTGNKGAFVSSNQAGSRCIIKNVTITFSSSTFTVFYGINTNAEIIAIGPTYSGTATVGAGGCWGVTTGGGLDTNGNLAAVTTACGGQTHSQVNPGWAQ